MLKSVKEFFKQVIRGISEHSIMEKSASLSYYALYALGPVLLLFVFVGRIFIEEEVVRNQVLNYFGDRLGHQSVPFFENIIENLVAVETGFLFSLVTFAIFVFGIYVFFNFLRRTFFDIFGVDLGQSRGLGKKLVNQIFYALYIFILFFLLFSTMIINIGSPIIHNITLNLFSDFIPAGLLNVSVALLIFVLTAILFGLIYSVLSLHTISFKSAFLGGIWASVTIAALNVLLSVYLAVSVTHSLYGLAGSLVVFLVWVHYAGMALFLGAETAKAHSDKI